MNAIATTGSATTIIPTAIDPTATSSATSNATGETVGGFYISVSQVNCCSAQIVLLKHGKDKNEIQQTAG